jgi:hypothetical protein
MTPALHQNCEFVVIIITVVTVVIVVIFDFSGNVSFVYLRSLAVSSSLPTLASFSTLAAGGR